MHGSVAITFRLSHDIGSQKILCAIVVINVLGVDLDIQSILGLIFHFQKQVIDIVTESLAMRASNRELCVEAARRLVDV